MAIQDVFGLRFDHLVVFQRDRSVFACARTTDGRVRIFLAFEDGRGQVYSRNGLQRRWEPIRGELAQRIRNRISTARGDVPVYKLNGRAPLAV